MDNLIKDNKSIIIFSIARSGTHMAMRYLLELGYKEWYPCVAQFGVENTFNIPKEGHFAFAGHIEYDDWKDSFVESGVNGIYVSRNPMDSVVSQAYYIKDREPQNPLHSVFQHLTYQECMNLLIDGYEPFLSIHERYEKNDKWGDLDNVINLKYEDLVKIDLPNDRYKYFFRNGGVNEWKNYTNVDWYKMYDLAEEKGYSI